MLTSPINDIQLIDRLNPITGRPYPDNCWHAIPQDFAGEGAMEFSDRERRIVDVSMFKELPHLLPADLVGRRFISTEAREGSAPNLPIILTCVGHDGTHLRTKGRGSYAAWVCRIEINTDRF